jgi:hypothetical protein
VVQALQLQVVGHVGKLAITLRINHPVTHMRTNTHTATDINTERPHRSVPLACIN